VKETLKSISEGDTSKYTIRGMPVTGTRNGTIAVKSITKTP
jgi:hypothetical protein